MAGASEDRECLETYRERAGKPAFVAATHREDAPRIFLKVVDRLRARTVVKGLPARWGRVGKGRLDGPKLEWVIPERSHASPHDNEHPVSARNRGVDGGACCRSKSRQRDHFCKGFRDSRVFPHRWRRLSDARPRGWHRGADPRSAVAPPGARLLEV